MKTGILGGGQLARMLMEECYKFGFEFHILSKEKDSPAGQLTKYEVTGDWNDEICLEKFADNCDIITLENEFIDYKKLKCIEKTGKEIFPSSSIIKLIQDKYFQKNTLVKSGIPVADFREINSKNDIRQFISEKEFPVVLKSRTMGYDGKGNFTINNEEDIGKAFDSLSRVGKLMCEKFISFETEIATQVVRSKSGEVRVYPLVETIQKNHICNMVIASEKKFGNITNKVRKIAEKIVTDLEYIGVMGIEMFLTGNDIVINELAPRVHNSGHYTIEGCRTSQFENHMRAIMDYPTGDTEMTCKNAVMINILGERNGDALLSGEKEFLKKENVYLHIYGKNQTRIGRKMGHITVLNDNLDDAISIAAECREIIDI